MPSHIKDHGILDQYFSGFALSVSDQSAPRHARKCVVDETVRTTCMIGDFNILKSDVRPDNFIVVPAPNGESDKDWDRAKWQQDEEWARHMMMRQCLQRFDFEYKLKPSMRFLEWAPGEDDD